MDYLRYYIPMLIQLAAYAGFAVGGNWVFVGIASLPTMALVNSLLPNDLATRKMKAGFIADLPVWISTIIMAVGLYLMAARWVAVTPDIAPWRYLGAVLSAPG